MYRYHFDKQYQTLIETKVKKELCDFKNIIKTMSDDEIGRRLLWFGDNNDLNRVVHKVVSQNGGLFGGHAEPFIFAYAFNVKTICNHTLPRPYHNCICNFQYKHTIRLIEDLKYNGYYEPLTM